MDFWDIFYTFILPAIAGGILGPIYARWFRWWRRSRKQKKQIQSYKAKGLQSRS